MVEEILCSLNLCWAENCIKNTFLVYKSPILSSFMKDNICYLNLTVFPWTCQSILHRLVTKCQVQCCTSLPMISPKIAYIFCILICNNDIILSEHVMRLIVVPFWVHFSTSGAPKWPRRASPKLQRYSYEC